VGIVTMPSNGYFIYRYKGKQDCISYIITISEPKEERLTVTLLP